LIWPFKVELHLPVVVKNAGIFFLAGGKLITTGLYSIVRHPAYGAILISALGLSLWIGDGARLMLSACLLFFFGAKSKIEEKWLESKFPEYISYKERVNKKFIPGIY